jgi:predicted dehydrogenase
MGIFRFAGGALASLHSSWTEWNEYMYLEIYGKEGYLRIDGRQPHCLTILGRRNGDRDVFDFSSQPPQSYQLEFDDFVQAIRTNRQPLPSGFDGLRAVQMAYGIYESSRSGRSIPVWSPVEAGLLEAHRKIAGGGS